MNPVWWRAHVTAALGAGRVRGSTPHELHTEFEAGLPSTVSKIKQRKQSEGFVHEGLFRALQGALAHIHCSWLAYSFFRFETRRDCHLV